MDPSLRPEKQVIKPVSAEVQSQVHSELKGQILVKPRAGQCRLGIKRKILPRFYMHQAHDKQEQPKLLPGRRPIIQIAERPGVELLKIVTQPKMVSKVPEIRKPILTEKLIKHI